MGIGIYESIFPDLRSGGKILCRGKESGKPSGPLCALGMVFRKFEVTSGPVVWAKVTRVPLASASHP